MPDNQRNLKYRIIIVMSILFAIVSILLLLVFYAGKKTYTVKFDLNGGTLISGSLVQTVTQGQNAVPPTVVKDGAYLHSWSADTNHVTKNITAKAIWEYKTTEGIIYTTSGSQNFAEISGCYEFIKGDVYLGAYYGDKKILGIRSNAFANRTAITGVYLLNGLMSIGDSAFLGCTGLLGIEIPETVTHLGTSAFYNCSSLETLTLHDGLWEIGDSAFSQCTALLALEIPGTVAYIGDSAFAGCTSLETLVIHEGVVEIGANAFKNCSSLKELVIPASVQTIHKDAFDGCDDLIIYASVTKEEMPEGWEKGWLGDAGVIWVGAEDEIETETETIVFPSIRPPRPFWTEAEDEEDITEETDTNEETEESINSEESDITEPEETEETEETESEEESVTIGGLVKPGVEFETIDKDIIGGIIERPGIEIETAVKEDISDLLGPNFPFRPGFPSLDEETTSEELTETIETEVTEETVETEETEAAKETDSGNK